MSVKTFDPVRKGKYSPDHSRRYPCDAILTFEFRRPQSNRPHLEGLGRSVLVENVSYGL